MWSEGGEGSERIFMVRWRDDATLLFDCYWDRFCCRCVWWAQSSPQPDVVSQTEQLSALDTQIADAESQLVALRRIYRESYPDIRTKVAALRQIYKPNYPDIRIPEQQRQILSNRRDELTKKQ